MAANGGKQLEAFPTVGGNAARLVERVVKQREQITVMRQKADDTETAFIQALEKLGKKKLRCLGHLVTLIESSPRKHIKITTPKEDKVERDWANENTDLPRLPPAVCQFRTA